MTHVQDHVSADIGASIASAVSRATGLQELSLFSAYKTAFTHVVFWGRKYLSQKHLKSRERKGVDLGGCGRWRRPGRTWGRGTITEHMHEKILFSIKIIKK